jgi:hypothetical protein
LNWLQSAEVPVYFDQRLEKVDWQNGKISRLMMTNGNRFSAPVFIDATYEGDLLASAAVAYHVGREANSVYRETLNGVHYGHPNIARARLLSSSHIVFGSIRMEPVFMILGQSAATAAALALEARCAVQEVDYSKLRNKLVADKQVLEWKK